jgi:hypothetical protein
MGSQLLGRSRVVVFTSLQIISVPLPHTLPYSLGIVLTRRWLVAHSVQTVLCIG